MNSKSTFDIATKRAHLAQQSEAPPAKPPAGDRPTMITLSSVRGRGWTLGLIKQFLDPPDLLRPSPHYVHAGAPMKLYKLARVEAAEQSPGFQAAKAKAKRGSNAAVKAVATKTTKLLQEIASMSVEVERVENARELAIESYNDNQWARGKFGNDAHDDSNPDFLDRITINFIRHELTEYDNHLADVAGRVGTRQAYVDINRKIAAEIARVYPELAQSRHVYYHGERQHDDQAVQNEIQLIRQLGQRHGA